MKKKNRVASFFKGIGRVFNRGYSSEGASTLKRALKGFKADSGSPIEDIDYNNSTLRQRARILYMGSPIATSAIKTNRTNVIGTGLRLNPKINAEVLEEKMFFALRRELFVLPEAEEHFRRRVKCQHADLQPLFLFLPQERIQNQPVSFMHAVEFADCDRAFLLCMKLCGSRNYLHALSFICESVS